MIISSTFRDQENEVKSMGRVSDIRLALNQVARERYTIAVIRSKLVRDVISLTSACNALLIPSQTEDLSHPFPSTLFVSY